MFVEFKCPYSKICGWNFLARYFKNLILSIQLFLKVKFLKITRKYYNHLQYVKQRHHDWLQNIRRTIVTEVSKSKTQVSQQIFQSLKVYLANCNEKGDAKRIFSCLSNLFNMFLFHHLTLDPSHQFLKQGGSETVQEGYRIFKQTHPYLWQSLYFS